MKRLVRIFIAWIAWHYLLRKERRRFLAMQPGPYLHCPNRTQTRRCSQRGYVECMEIFYGVKCYHKAPSANKDIDNVWYVKALKAMTEKEPPKA